MRIDDPLYYRRIHRDKNFRIEELKKYSLLRLSKGQHNHLHSYIYDHIDFIILLACYRMYDCNYFDYSDYDKILDIIFGYEYAYKEGYISDICFINKLNEEIISKWLFPKSDFNEIAVRFDDTDK